MIVPSTGRSALARLALAAVLAVPTSALVTALAADDELDAASTLERLQGWLDGTRDLSGKFSQELASGALGAELSESGKLYIQRPGRMRWDYREPESKLALVDGSRTWLWIEEDQQLTLGHLDPESQLLPTLLAGDGRLAELFRAVLLETPEDGNRIYRLQLEPHELGEAVERVTLTLRPPRFAIEVAEVLDAVGNRMVYRFSDLRRNRGLADDLFRFEPPPGVEIVGNHE